MLNYSCLCLIFRPQCENNGGLEIIVILTQFRNRKYEVQEVAILISSGTYCLEHAVQPDYEEFINAIFCLTPIHQHQCDSGKIRG